MNQARGHNGNGYSVRVNGRGYQWANASFEKAVEQVVQAHRDGDKWAVRRRTGNGGELRLLTEEESQALVAAVAEKVTA